MPTVTMQSVAALAGVTRTTVSRVIRSPHLVAEETRLHVKKILHDCGYVYHAAAANLTRGKMSTVGLVLPTVRSNAFASTILAVQEAAQNLDMTVVLGSTQYNIATETRLLQQFLEHRLAGVILVGFCVGNEYLLHDLNRVGIPTVVIWETLDIPELSYVGFNNIQAADDMTSYLISLGHQRIGLLLGPLEASYRVRQRLQGYQNALTRHNLPFEPALIRSSLPTLAEGRAGMRRLLHLRPHPTAVFASSDVLAIGAMNAAQDMGLRVPEDIAVAGFDGIEFSAYTRPKLTTIVVPERQMIWQASKYIAQCLHTGTCTLRTRCLKTRIVIRESCGGQKQRP